MRVMKMEELPLFVWSVLITAWLLLISLPVLAGMFSASSKQYNLLNLDVNLAICWEILYYIIRGQSADIHLYEYTQEMIIIYFYYNSLLFSCWEIFDTEILRDFTPE
jgi:hypothetical protein